MISDLEQLLSEPESDVGATRQQQVSTTNSREKIDGVKEGKNTMSKAQRIRDYWEQHPGARNKDVAEALKAFGVTAAHVSNAKAQLEAKLQKKKKKHTDGAAAKKSGQRGRPAGTSASGSPTGKIDVELFGAAVEFVRRAGGMNEALHILNLIREIRSL